MFSNRKQLDRMERKLTAIQALVAEMVGRPVENTAATIEAASKCFTAGYEAAKVESLQCAQPVFLNPEARADFRRGAEASGTAMAQGVMNDPNNANFLSGDDLSRGD